MRTQTFFLGLKLMPVLLCFGQSAQAVPLFTPINSGPETSVASIIGWIEDHDGISLSRVSDDLDALWELFSGPSTVQARARYAGYDNLFGVIPGVGIGTAGFLALGDVKIQNGIAGKDMAPSIALPDITGQFRLAIQTPHQIWSSLAGDNSDLADHTSTTPSVAWICRGFRNPCNRNWRRV
jgi:hypothetical protein